MDLWCEEETGTFWDRIKIRPGQPTLTAEQSNRAKAHAVYLARALVQTGRDEFESVFRQRYIADCSRITSDGGVEGRNRGETRRV